MPCKCKELVLENGAFHVKQPKVVNSEVEPDTLVEQGKPAELSNTAALSIECLVADLGLEREDAEWLVNLGVGCSSNDDALSVLGHALVASIERAKELETTLDARDVALESLQEAYDDVERQYNDLAQAFEGAHDEVEGRGDD